MLSRHRRNQKKIGELESRNGSGVVQCCQALITTTDGPQFHGPNLQHDQGFAVSDLAQS